MLCEFGAGAKNLSSVLELDGVVSTFISLPEAISTSGGRQRHPGAMNP